MVHVRYRRPSVFVRCRPPYRIPLPKRLALRPRRPTANRCRVSAHIPRRYPMRRLGAVLAAVTVFLTGPPDVVPARVPDMRAVVLEDNPAWDCRTDGNRVCGLSNSQHVPAGRYSGP
jgi:hypothetical protein